MINLLHSNHFLVAVSLLSVLLLVVIITSILLLIFRNSWISQKIYWVGKEVIKIYSNIPSFFSQKRIQQNILFAGGYFVLIHHYIVTRATISTMETCEIGTLLFGFAGYHLAKVEQSKKDGTINN